VKVKRRRSRKGVSPVISNLILIAAALGLGIFVYWFALTRSTIATTDYANVVGTGIEKLEERFVVEHIEIKYNISEDNYDVTIWIYNYGKIFVNITDLYLEHTLVNDDPIRQIIKIGEIKPINITSDFMPKFVQVQSERGTVVVGS